MNAAPKEVKLVPASKSRQIGAALNKVGRAELISKPLDNISLEIFEGQSFGLVGANGAGKTTLLKVLSKAMEPQEGTVEIEGRPTSLLSMGAGINPKLSGYDNIIQRGLWLGRTKQELTKRLPEIAQTTGLGDYLNASVSVYSAGMRARLLFATVTAFDPEILLLDEGMIVGDEAFQRTARSKLRSLIENSGITVLASHAPNFLKDTCTHGIWLESGRLKAIGNIDDVIEQYQQSESLHAKQR